MSYSENDYQRERAICDKTMAYAEKFRQKNGWIVISEEDALHPDYAACDNAMRGRVEQFEILRDLPEKFSAYLESGADDNAGSNLAVIVWTGDILGRAWVYTVGKRQSMSGDRQRYGRARIGGKLYAWQGPGAGMYAIFRAIKGES
jgi:hypothetical protein